MHLLFPLVALAVQARVISAAAPDYHDTQQQQPLDFTDASQPHLEILNADVDAAINSILQDFRSPGGVGAAVVRKGPDGSGWSVETKGYGVAKLDGTKATSDTLFCIGSNSKLFDILATGLLISNKSLSTPISWDTKMASVMPEWGIMDPVASAESTIVDVMSHRTGLPRHDLIIPFRIRRLRYLRPSTGFREQWQYNNHMYTVLSYFPQLLTGIPFETYVDEFIIQPLGMHSTTYFSRTAKESGHLADGIAREGVNLTEDVFGLGTLRALPYWLPNDKPGHGTIDNGRHPATDSAVIPADVVRRVAAGVTVALPVAQFPELSPGVYGGGQFRGTYRGFVCLLGFRSQVTRIPSQNFGVAVLSNDDSFGTPIVEAIKFLIIDEAMKLNPVDWSARFKSGITASFKGRTIPTPRPINATAPLHPFDKLAGRYQNLGYGTIELCFVTSDRKSAANSAACARLIEEIPTTLPDAIDPSVPILLAKYPFLRLTHISLAHFEHNVFNFSGLNSVVRPCRFVVFGGLQF
ncbi:beta-lactamase/transpeptidase-like protein [Mycena pura]|uniref:Beta-lactamase/transpeptidase-like protein n=1 Tax=Mycena pura TaxID=153505 RepID=A0AAD6VBH9_9AGAR|nr:beta-lactamase/transpeptidase-like protein [Mycena pura]